MEHIHSLGAPPSRVTQVVTLKQPVTLSDTRPSLSQTWQSLTVQGLPPATLQNLHLVYYELPKIHDSQPTLLNWVSIQTEARLKVILFAYEG